MQPILNMALRAARGAAQQLARVQERLDLALIEHQGADNLLRDCGSQVEKSMSYTLRKAYHDHHITGLYIGHKAPKGPASDVHWYLNPLVGTDNFTHGLPQTAIAIVCKVKDRVEHCVVINPISGDEFTASRGQGAQLNGKRIRVAGTKTLEGAVLSCALPPKAYRDQYLPPFQAIQLDLARQTDDLQNLGCPLLGMANVAAGRLDGMIQMGMDELEMQAGALLLQEAGGLVGDLTGNAHYFKSGNLVCGNPKMFKTLLQTIQPHLTPSLKRA